MNIFICAQFFSFMTFLNYVQSSPMPMTPLPNLRVHIDHVPNLPIRPQLATRNGQVVGIYYNGKIYDVEEVEPEPAPERETLSPRPQLLSGAIALPDGAFVYRGASPVGTVRWGAVYDLMGQAIIEIQNGDLALHIGAPVAMYENDRWRSFRSNRLG